MVLAVAAAACGRPDEQGLRDSFAQQLAANRFVTDVRHEGNEITFTGPGPEGGTAKWRVEIESAVIEENSTEGQPYRGTIRSAWYADGQRIEPSLTEANLPFELLSNGLSQHCWAFWDEASERWLWE
jgi:hypothetical protein